MDAALLAAAVALTTVYLTQFLAEKYRRHRDAAAIAAGIAGELSSYVDGFNILDTFLRECRESAKLGNKPLFRVGERPKDYYFPKVVEKIGLLGPDLCESVIYVYANLEGFRGAYMLLNERHADMDCVEIEARITLCLDALWRAAARADELVPKLRAKAGESWSPFR